MKKKMLLMATILIVILLTWTVATYAAPRAYVTYSDQQAATVDISVYFDDQGGVYNRVYYATVMKSDGSDMNWIATTVSGADPARRYVFIDNAAKFMNYYVKIANSTVTDATYVRLFPVTTSAQREFNDYAHGNFRPDTPMCGGCHSTHSALKAQLLKKATYYELCMLCHGNANSQSKYDVESGLVKVSGTTKPSLAGPFVSQSGTPAVSLHNADDRSLVAREVPGSNLTKRLSLTCVSCHNGHGGNNDNYRLLKKTIYASDDKSLVSSNVYYDAFAVTDSATSGETVSMVRGNTEFCAACHLDFDDGNAWVKGGQYSPASVDGKVYMHPVTVRNVVYSVYGIDGTKNPSFEPTFGDILPLQFVSTQTGKTDKRTGIVCSTCHFAHGSTKSFNVQDTVYDGKYMLRLDNYGVCQSCHKK
jgi:predicted CXXCH cytochrome family protein